MSSILKTLASTVILCAAFNPAHADPAQGLVQLAVPTLACDKLSDMQSLVSIRQKSWDKFKTAFIAMQTKMDKFKEPICVYEQLGLLSVGDKKGDIIDLGVQLPDQADHPDHVWLVHVSNPKTDFWVLWAERIATVNPSACDTTKSGCI